MMVLTEGNLRTSSIAFAASGVGIAIDIPLPAVGTRDPAAMWERTAFVAEGWTQECLEPFRQLAT